MYKKDCVLHFTRMAPRLLSWYQWSAASGAKGTQLLAGSSYGNVETEGKV